MKKLSLWLCLLCLIVMSGCSKDIKKLEYKDMIIKFEDNFKNIDGFKLHLDSSYKLDDEETKIEANLLFDLKNKIIQGNLVKNKDDIDIFVDYRNEKEIIIYYKKDNNWLFRNVSYNEVFGENINIFPWKEKIKNLEMKKIDKKDEDYHYLLEMDSDLIYFIFEELIVDEYNYINDFMDNFHDQLTLELITDSKNILIKSIMISSDEIYNNDEKKITNFNLNMNFSDYGKIEKIELPESIVKKSNYYVAYENKKNINLDEFYELEYDKVLLCTSNRDEQMKIFIYLGFNNNILARIYTNIFYDYYDEDLAKTAVEKFNYNVVDYPKVAYRYGTIAALNMMKYDFVTDMPYDIVIKYMENEKYTCY